MVNCPCCLRHVLGFLFFYNVHLWGPMGSGLYQNCTCTTRPRDQQYETISRSLRDLVTEEIEEQDIVYGQTDGRTKGYRISVNILQCSCLGDNFLFFANNLCQGLTNPTAVMLWASVFICRASAFIVHNFIMDKSKARSAMSLCPQIGAYCLYPVCHF